MVRVWAFNFGVWGLGFGVLLFWGFGFSFLSFVFMRAGRKVTVASGLKLHRLLQLHVSQIGHVIRVRMMRMGFEGMVRK